MPSSFTLKKPNKGIIGHRGASGYAPENTLASIKLAHSMGLDWVEVDIQLAADQTLVVFHDDTLNRTTDATGKLSDQTVSSLKNLDAGLWFSNEYARETIPTLSETLACVLELGIFINLEAKFSTPPDKDTIQTFLNTLEAEFKQFWPKGMSLPLVSCFDLNFMKAYRKHFPDAPIGLLTEKLSDEDIELATNLKNCTLNVNSKDVSPEKITSLISLEVPLLIYTVNEPVLGLQYLESGAFGIFSDFPDLFELF